jgi:hypothetical protein
MLKICENIYTFLNYFQQTAFFQELRFLLEFPSFKILENVEDFHKIYYFLIKLSTISSFKRLFTEKR